MKAMRAGKLLLPSLLLAASAQGADFSALERRAAEQIAAGALPSLAVAIAEDGRIVYERAFGLADIASDRAAGVHTAYALASASKPITATALMRLVEQGRVRLDAPVARYIAPLRFQGANGRVTLRQLLGHSSGLGTYAHLYYADAIATAPDFAHTFERFGVLVQPPGRVAEYSNLGYGLLGHVIERRSGRPFADYLRSEVFEPLGMHDAFVDTPRAGASDLATSYDAQMQPLPWLYNDTPGAGNVHASVHDLIRFAMFHLGDSPVERPPLSPAGVRRMQRNAAPRALQHYYGGAYYGHGWYVRPDDDGYRVVWHEGGMPGASSIVKLIPQRRIAVAVLANKTEVNALTQSFADELVRVLLPDYDAAPLDPVANYVAYAAQQEFLGTWQGEIQVDGRGVPCSLRFGDDGKVHLSYTPQDRVPVKGAFGGIVYGDSFVGAVPLALPIAEQAGATAPLTLVKLLRSGDVLQGALVAYAQPARLEYLLPFHVRLTRAVEPTR